MKYRYRFHPDEYALGENEKFYSDMEARGWRLVKRGQYLSKFAPVEPSHARYRIEVSAPGFMEESYLPEEQLAVFADCGWEHVTDRGMLHVFRAPAGSDAPEFYADPRQQAATLKKLRRSYVWAWVPAVLSLGFEVLLIASLSGGVSVTLTRLGTEFRGAWIEDTAFLAGFGFWLLWLLYTQARGAWIISRTYRRMKRGIPLDHSPGGRHLAHKVISRGLLALIALCALLALAQWVDTKEYDLPLEPDGPYLLLEELGETGERTQLFYDDRVSEVKVTRSLLATHYDVFEVVKGGNNQIWMYQDVYRLRQPASAMEFAEILMDVSTFGRGAENFTPVAVDGLDAAWLFGDLEVVAVKGNLVTYVTYLGRSAAGGDAHLRALLPVLAERWSE